jgi:secreted Zn-dependent insulinase-like peptidase
MEEVDFSVSRSDADQKEYRLITLECGLECLLVSTLAKDLLSPTDSNGGRYNKAAAAMAVQVGSFGDPVQTGADDDA